MALIAEEVAPAARPAIEEPAPVSAAPAPAPAAPANLARLVRPTAKAASTLRTRACRLSVYLEPPVYDCLRDIAYEERTKLHPLILEAIDLLLKKRGSRSIKELTRSLIP